MEFLLIIIVSFGAAILTFFSGFGLGTILLPVFAVFFPVEMAIAMTAIVHLANNFFKLFLVKTFIDKSIVIRFAIPASIFAFIGAYTLKLMTSDMVLLAFTINNFNFEISLLKLIIGVLMFIFAIIELNKKLQQITFSSSYLPLGGSLSGFFGGLSGHQGALRSMFLIKSGLSKEAFIATGIATAVLIDISRLSIYGFTFFTKNENLTTINNAYQLVVLACVAAFLGSYLGKKFLKKVTIDHVNTIVGVMILTTSFLLIFGII